MVTKNYTTEWVEANFLCTNISIVIIEFIFEHNIINFNCP